MPVMELKPWGDTTDGATNLSAVLGYMAWPSLPRRQREMRLAAGAFGVGVIERSTEMLARPEAVREAVRRGAAKAGLDAEEALVKLLEKCHEPGGWRNFAGPLANEYPIPATTDEFLDRLTAIFGRVGTEAKDEFYDRHVRPNGAMLGIALCDPLPSLVNGIVKAHPNGATAAIVLLTIASLNLTGAASVNRAIWLLERWKEKWNKRHINTPFPYDFCPGSKSEIKNRWRDYKCVAHLWMAYLQLTYELVNEGTCRNTDDLAGKITDMICCDLPRFLSLARDWQYFATTFRSDSHQKPIIDEDIVFSVPTSYPGLRPPNELCIHPLPPDIISLANTYQVPKAYD